MRVTIDWLKEWVDGELDPQEVAEALTTAGLEVDAVLPVAGEFDSVVVAEILDCKRHPDADRLSICEVDTGGTRSTVVCGAPNARVGLKTAFASVGASLPEGRSIKSTKVRGVISHGMLCSASELGLGDDSSGLLELSSDAENGADLRAYLALDDHILDVDLTPNRGDCFCVLGIARELAARQQLVLRQPQIAAVPAMSDETFPVALPEPSGCSRFAGRVIKNVPSGVRSPIWLTERLRRAGLRAIHPVVDVTNYVMLELGQPLHSYDLRKLTRNLQARWAVSGESLTLLDGRRVELADDMLVIADGAGPVGLAGIMGGQSTSVDENTVDVFLEAAFFPPTAISGRARRLGLHTDASMRFERGVDPTGQARAIERATALLLEIAGGEPGPLVDISSDEHFSPIKPILLRGDRLASILGQDLAAEKITDSLERLGMRVDEQSSGNWHVSPPSFRFDLSIEEDLVEEVARLVGYDSIAAVPERTMSRLGTATEHRVDESAIADLLVARGYSEIVSYSFVDPRLAELINPDAPHERLENPISQELAVMRRSLWPGLIQAAVKNLSRQRDRLQLFEIGTQFLPGSEQVLERRVLAGLVAGPRYAEQWGLGRQDADFYDVKGDLEALCELTGRQADLRCEGGAHPALRPGRTATIRLGSEQAGWIGELHPRVQQAADLKIPVVLFAIGLNYLLDARLPAYAPFSRFPSLRRDLAIVVANEVSAQALSACVSAAAGENLQNVIVFDVYRGPGIDSSRKSVGLGLILQDTSRTLTDEDADRTVAAVVEHLQRELGATIRN